ncbi:MAG: FtsQ-type POTRA domain-containing protein [Clostridia bacterium]|nr:FtsQ-type POTRA domain-containing protein [Clostridia bacterium]
MSQQIPPVYPANGGYIAPPPQTQNAPKRTGAFTIVAMVALIFAIVVILNETMLKIRNVAVIGNEKYSWEEVVRAAGLDRPTSYFTLDEQTVIRNLASNHYLVFERMEKGFPNRLTLYVHERKPIARVQEMGLEYVLDEDGMVLERVKRETDEDKEKAAQFNGLMFITGLKPKEIRIGHILQAGSSAQMEAFKALIREAILQGITAQISELNITDPESLYLITTDNFTAHLGTVENLRAKIGTVRAVVAYLRTEGSGGGMLEASIPGEAVFSPMAP